MASTLPKRLAWSVSVLPALHNSNLVMSDFIISNYMQDPAPFAEKILHLIETRVLMQRQKG